jgi:hypothetical protein
MRPFLKRLWTFSKLAVLLILVGLMIASDNESPGAFDPAVNRLIGRDEFDFISWEAETLAAKGEEVIVPAPDYLDGARRKSIVLNYIDLVRRIDDLQNEIDNIYADPKVADPAAASARQREELAQLRAQQAGQQTIVETIIEEQVSTILGERGFALGGQVMPPLKFRFSPLPQMLIISPRDQIYQKDAFPLSAGLTTDRAEQLENEIDQRFKVSSLVVPIGGLGIYPSMVLETTSLEWMLHAAAHEWTHNWLEFHPLGINYETSPELRTMNETTADIVGQEVGDLALRRFYPELAPPPSSTPTPGPTPTPAPTPTPNPNVFNFRAEMHTTRVEVDRLLTEARAAEKAGDQVTADARINQAEEYMRERRTFFVDHGYLIRKLNQAYFAFYGAYADEPGAAGADPVGPAVKLLRDRSPSLLAFLETMAPMTSFDQLKRALGEQ